MRNSSETREVLRYVERLQGSTIFFAPSGIGPIKKSDLGVFLQDVALLISLGVRVVLADYEDGTFWDNLELPRGALRKDVAREEDLVRCATTHSAIKLCLLAGTDRVVTTKGHQLDDVPLADARHFLDDRAFVTEESEAALRLATSACEAGIRRVHIINAHRDGALLNEFFTNRGVGTMVYAGLHKEVRAMLPGDRDSVCTLMHDVVPQRTIEFVRDQGHEIRVFAVDEDVHGIARIVLRGKTLLVLNLACAANSNAAEVLESLLRAVLKEAGEQGMDAVGLISEALPPRMRILPWFKSLGFAKGKISHGVGKQDAWLRQVDQH